MSTQTNTTKGGNFLTNWFHKQEIAYDETRYGHMVFYLTFQSCLGSIAAMYTLETNGNIFWLILAAAITMGANAMFIAQASARTCLLTFYASVLINVAIILIHIL